MKLCIVLLVLDTIVNIGLYREAKYYKQIVDDTYGA